MMRNRQLLYGALIVNEGRAFKGYVEIEGERIKRVGVGEVPEYTLHHYPAHARHNLEGKWLLPGVIDDQVHFREPGAEHKADISTESRAAAAGGVTSYMDMPNTKPQTVTVNAWEDKMRRASEKSAVNYAFFMGATNDNFDTLERMDRTKVPGVKVFLGSSTGNMLVDNEPTLDRVFSLPDIIAVHSEDEAIIRRNAAEISKKYAEGEVPLCEHPNIRSREACVESTRKAIARAEKFGTHLHIFHISTSEETDMLRQAKKKAPVTGEVCVHHLWFTDADYATLGARVKCNPAVKTSADRDALRRALKEGVIDVVATDHAPHLLSEKEGDALHAASGLPLVQFSLPAMLEMSSQGLWSLKDVVEWMCHNPAKLYHIKDRGYIHAGYYADLVVVDPEKPFTVTPDILQSKCGWSPFEGHTFPHSIAATFVNGLPVYSDGRVNDDVRGKALTFNR